MGNLSSAYHLTLKFQILSGSCIYQAKRHQCSQSHEPSRKISHEGALVRYPAWLWRQRRVQVRSQSHSKEAEEYSFLLSRDCKLYNRREFKIVSAFVSLFTTYYVFHWKDHFPDTSLKYPPSFDGRAVLYPDIKNVRDYFSWRQTDCI